MKSGGAVCHNEIDIFGYKAVDDRRARIRFALRVLQFKFDIFLAELVDKRLLKTLGSSVERDVRRLLADADRILFLFPA